MTSSEIHDKVQELVKNFNKESFIYDLLRAYGISKTSITRLQKGDFNLAKNEGEILYKKKLFFKETESDELMALVEDLSKEENLKHNPRFVIVTNYIEIVAKRHKGLTKTYKSQLQTYQKIIRFSYHGQVKKYIKPVMKMKQIGKHPTGWQSCTTFLLKKTPPF